MEHDIAPERASLDEELVRETRQLLAEGQRVPALGKLRVATKLDFEASTKLLREIEANPSCETGFTYDLPSAGGQPENCDSATSTDAADRSCHGNDASEQSSPEVAATDEMTEATARNALERAKKEYEELGGRSNFKDGGWVFRLIQKSVKAYYEKANAEYFRHKYPGRSDDEIAKKLISVAARNASLIGAATGAVISTDEIVGIFTLGEGGVGIPANIAIATAAVGGEMVSVLRIQLQLVVNLAKLMNCPLDPDDPEDILIILAYAIGGGVAEAAGKMGMKIGARMTAQTIRKYISKEVLEALKALGRKIGVKILQRSIIKYAVPFASIGIGAGWNYTTTRSVGKIALRHFREREPRA